MTAAPQVFRITYEAFSKFTNNLNSCRSFEEIIHTFKVNLKYLFNYHVFRASYERNGIFVHFIVSPQGCTLSVNNQPDYLGYEEELQQDTIPLRWTNLNRFNLPGEYSISNENEPELWGWNFKNEDRHILISVLSSREKSFGNKDMHFLKLVSENLESKLLELCLFKELDEKNAIISNIIEEQKEVIKRRTQQIEDKNKTLLEISVLNAHNVREPLSRILGLIQLLEFETAESIISEIFPKLKCSSTDLDAALQNVITKATTELRHLKA